MGICNTCSNAVFEALWGEYKCGLNQVTYNNLVVCGDYKKGQPQDSKKNEDYYTELEDEK